jgi:ribosomal protein S18 acetylase RimI-like enzyme
VSDRAPVALRCAADVPPAALCDAFNASFAGYLVTFPTMDAADWQVFLRRQGCDLALSLAALRANEVVSFALITPRPHRRTRIAVMGARPAERGTGTAARLLDESIAASSARGDRWAELEVFAQNERAARLYRSRGLEPVDALRGFIAAPGTGAARDADIVEVSREEAAGWAQAFDRDHLVFLPWQAGGEAMLAASGALRAWRIGHAQMTFQESEALISVPSLLDRDAAYADAGRLIAALRHRFPERELRAPQIHRAQGPAQAFEAAGWPRQPLYQYLLRRQLAV